MPETSFYDLTKAERQQLVTQLAAHIQVGVTTPKNWTV